MASETVRKIEQAEADATEKIAEAQTIARQTIEKAKADAISEREAIIAKAKSEAGKLIGQSEAEYDVAMKNAENKREEISRQMYDAASKNEGKAFNAIKEIIIP